MHFEDLTPYTYAPPDEPGPQPLNVGWLGARIDFPVADPFPPFLEKLGTLCRAPVELMRGFHVCEMCGFDPMYHDARLDAFLGNGEVRVEGLDGTIYAAPVMIYHYVRDHLYAPPAAFREAVMMHCRLCGGRLQRKIEGRTQGLFCSACADWDVVTSYWAPIEIDLVWYAVTVTGGDPGNLAQIKALAEIVGGGFLGARERLGRTPSLRFSARALDLVPRLAMLEAAGLATAIEPAFPYTAADAVGCARAPKDSLRLIYRDDVPAPPVVENQQDRLATPESYPGLSARERADRALLLIRTRQLLPSSAYALFAGEQAWTLRRVEAGHLPGALYGDGLFRALGRPAWVSFGADATIPQDEARGFLAKARRLRRLGRPAREGIMIDGPDTYAIHIGAERYDYFAEEDAFQAECAAIEAMIAAFDRLLPASTLRERIGRW